MRRLLGHARFVVPKEGDLVEEPGGRKARLASLEFLNCRNCLVQPPLPYVHKDRRRVVGHSRGIEADTPKDRCECLIISAEQPVDIA